MDYYQQASTILAPLNLQVVEMRLNSDNDWQVVLNNGLKVQLGQNEILTRLQRFVKVYPKVFANGKKKAKTVDLRYANGMAIRWN